MSVVRRTVEPPEWLKVLLDDVQKAITPLAESPGGVYKLVEDEMPNASLHDIEEAFHLRIESLLEGTTMQERVGREAAHAYADLFDLKAALNSIATVNDHGIRYLLRHKKRITPEALWNFWHECPLGDLAIWGTAARQVASRGTLATRAREGEFGKTSLLEYIPLAPSMRFVSEPIETLFSEQLMWRLRKCWHCQTIFWAGRVDKLTCSAKCGDARRQSLVRERKRDKGPQNREQEREPRRAYLHRKTYG
jgi:hypothetical protein